MRSLVKDKTGTVQDIGMAVAILVSIIVAVVIVYNMAGAMDVSNVDNTIQSNLIDIVADTAESADGAHNYTIAGNATVDILDQSATFFTIAPLVVVVLVAVVILSYVMQIGGATGRRP